MRYAHPKATEMHQSHLPELRDAEHQLAQMVRPNATTDIANRRNVALLEWIFRIDQRYRHGRLFGLLAQSIRHRSSNWFGGRGLARAVGYFHGQ